jgi:hypothetical protein
VSLLSCQGENGRRQILDEGELLFLCLVFPRSCSIPAIATRKLGLGRFVDPEPMDMLRALAV